MNCQNENLKFTIFSIISRIMMKIRSVTKIGMVLIPSFLMLSPSLCIAEIKTEKAMTPQMMFMESIQSGQVEAVSKYVKEGNMDPNQVFEGGVTPLHVAVMKNQEPVVAVLLQGGARINEKDTTTMSTPLHMAALYGRTSVAKLLIQKGADVNARMKFGITPLMVAAQFNHPEIAEVLLNARANTQLPDEEGFTALHCAAQTGDEITAKLLIKHGARLDARDRMHATPFTIARQNNHAEMQRLLMNGEAAATATPLMPGPEKKATPHDILNAAINAAIPAPPSLNTAQQP